MLFTGDLVQSGKSEQFKEMQAEALDPLWEKLRELGSGDTVLLAVPGNHDLYRPNPLEDNAAVDVLLEKSGFQRIETKFWDQPAGGYRRVINDAFAAYSQWWDKAPHRPSTVKGGILPGDFSVTLELGGRRVGIVGLNTTFLQLTGGDYEGRLVWDARQLHAVCEGGVDIWSKQHDVCLLLTHQGPNWLTPEARKHGESEIAPAGRFAIHLFGHQHETDITYIRRGGARHAVRLCQGCSVFGMEKYGEPPKTQRAHGYAAGRIEIGETEAHLRLWPRIATNTIGRWRFIPDHDHAELEKDEGTLPEPVALRSRSAKITTVIAAPAETTSPALGPHSTLLARRPFFGRTKELEKIAKYLLPEDRSWGVVLDGPGGVGKAALALEAAHRAPAEHFPLKLWFTAKDRELLPHGEQKLQAVCDALASFLNFFGRWDDLLSLTTEAEVKAERVGDFMNAGRRALEAGWCHYFRGQSVEVLTCADRSATHWQTARAGAYERASASQLRGLGHRLARDYLAAANAYREALDLWRSLSPKSESVGIALNSLAGVLRELGQPDEAETHYREALSIANASSNFEGVAIPVQRRAMRPGHEGAHRSWSAGEGYPQT